MSKAKIDPYRPFRVCPESFYFLNTHECQPISGFDKASGCVRTGSSEAFDHGGGIVPAVEPVFEFGEGAGDVFGPDGAIGAGERGLHYKNATNTDPGTQLRQIIDNSANFLITEELLFARRVTPVPSLKTSNSTNGQPCIAWGRCSEHFHKLTLGPCQVPDIGADDPAVADPGDIVALVDAKDLGQPECAGFLTILEEAYFHGALASFAADHRSIPHALRGTRPP